MPPKRKRTTRKRRTRRLRGGERNPQLDLNWLQPTPNPISSAGTPKVGIFGRLKNWLKSRPLSSGATRLGWNRVSNVLHKVGLGRRRRRTTRGGSKALRTQRRVTRKTTRRRRLRGGSVPESTRVIAKTGILDAIRNPTASNIFSRLSNFNTALRQNHNISNGLARTGWNKLSAVARFLGYGKRRTVRRKTTRKRTLRGRGIKDIFGKIWSGIKSVGTTVAPIVTTFAAKKLLGMGRRRRTVRRTRKTRRTIRGRGIFSGILGSKGSASLDSIWNGIKKVGSHMAPTIGKFLAHKITGGRRRRTVRRKTTRRVTRRRTVLGGRRRVGRPRIRRTTTRRRRTLRGRGFFSPDNLKRIRDSYDYFKTHARPTPLRGVGRPRVRRVHRGRGIFGRLAGGVLGGLLPF